MMEIQNSLLGLAVLPKPAAPGAEGHKFPMADGTGKGLAPPGPEPPPAAIPNAREGEVATKPNATSIEPDSPSKKPSEVVAADETKPQTADTAVDTSLNADLLVALAADSFFGSAPSLETSKPQVAPVPAVDPLEARPQKPAPTSDGIEAAEQSVDVAPQSVDLDSGSADYAIGAQSKKSESTKQGSPEAPTADVDVSKDMSFDPPTGVPSDVGKPTEPNEVPAPTPQPAQQLAAAADVVAVESAWPDSGVADFTAVVDAVEPHPAADFAPKAMRPGTTADVIQPERSPASKPGEPVESKPMSEGAGVVDQASAPAAPSVDAANVASAPAEVSQSRPTKHPAADEAGPVSQAQDVQTALDAAPASDANGFGPESHDAFTDADLAAPAASKADAAESVGNAEGELSVDRKPSAAPSEPTPSVDRVTMATDGQLRITDAKPASETGAKENNQSEVAESVLRQVADRIELLAAAKPRNGVTVRLEPEEFGTITLIVRAHGNAVDAEVFAANDEVRKALDASRALLGSSLQARGITLQTLTVDTQAATFQAPTDQSARQAPTPQPGTAPAFFAAVDSNNAVDLATLRSFARKADGIDIWT